MKFILKSLQNIDNLMSLIFSNNANEKNNYLIGLKIKFSFFDVGQILRDIDLVSVI